MPNSGVMLVWIPCRLDRKRWRSPCNSSSFGSRADSSSSGSGGGGELGEGSLKKTCCLGKRDSNTGSIGGELLDYNCRCSRSIASGEVRNRWLNLGDEQQEKVYFQCDQ